jgi:hypothetical protein
MRPWRHCPKTLAVIARGDHLTTVRNAEKVHDMVRNCGAEVETWIAEGTHSFDEPTSAPPMRYHPELTDEAVAGSGPCWRIRRSRRRRSGVRPADDQPIFASTTISARTEWAISQCSWAAWCRASSSACVGAGPKKVVTGRRVTRFI